LDGGGYTEAARKQRVEAKESNSEIVEALEKYVKDEFPGVVDSAANDLAEAWNRAEEETSQIVPKRKRTPDDEASRVRGRELFLSAKAKCATCHGPLGHGDGPQTEDFQAKPGSNDKYEKPGLYDDWGNPLSPRDLTRGIYRGGRRPIDIYRRIRAGIKGTPMPSFTESTLSDEETWDLVNYVLSIPYSGPVPSGSATGEKATAAAEPGATPGAPHNVASVSESGGN
jgi:mono/diheme cytochrome c family protein